MQGIDHTGPDYTGSTRDKGAGFQALSWPAGPFRHTTPIFRGCIFQWAISTYTSCMSRDRRDGMGLHFTTVLCPLRLQLGRYQVVERFLWAMLLYMIPVIPH